MIDVRLAGTLARVATVMADAREPWWVIGSAAAALHGARVLVGDVDVLLSVADTERLLPAAGIAVSAGSAHPDFRSTLFATWRDPPLTVEFMAGLRHRRGSEWEEIEPATREAIAGEAGTVFVPGRDALIAMMTRFGRAKDIARVAALRRR